MDAIFQHVNLIKKFIQAERMGDWQLHLACVHEMIPIFHAAGHLSYAKYSHMYLQEMLALKDSMTCDEFKNFTEKGYFTIRRTDKFWAGVWTDMTIEQTLMCSMKTSGGITHGRGITEGVLARWIQGAPAACDLCDNVEHYSQVKTETSNKHTALRRAKT